jgi:hypothetical protein
MLACAHSVVRSGWPVYTGACELLGTMDYDFLLVTETGECLAFLGTPDASPWR